jgi:hypothetical protein
LALVSYWPRKGGRHSGGQHNDAGPDEAVLTNAMDDVVCW